MAARLGERSGAALLDPTSDGGFDVEIVYCAVAIDIAVTEATVGKGGVVRGGICECEYERVDVEVVHRLIAVHVAADDMRGVVTEGEDGPEAVVYRKKTAVGRRNKRLKVGGVTPADNGSIRLQSDSVGVSSGDRGEATVWRRKPAKNTSEHDNRTIGAKCNRETWSAGNRCKATVRRRHVALPDVVATPRRDGTVGP